MQNKKIREALLLPGLFFRHSKTQCMQTDLLAKHIFYGV
jgi:hypothetical protein